ncbi:MAG: DNA-binding protein [Actinomyces sp.]|nr:DNA-binding protein [Actinomyces sp.]
MSNRPARIRAIVVAVLVLAFVIPWTYAHIAYAWPWKRFQTGTLISCDNQYLVGGYPNKPPELLGHLSDGAPVDFIAGGEINMGVETGDFGLAAQRGNEIDNFAHSPQLHLGEASSGSPPIPVERHSASHQTRHLPSTPTSDSMLAATITTEAHP